MNLTTAAVRPETVRRAELLPLNPDFAMMSILPTVRRCKKEDPLKVGVGSLGKGHHMASSLGIGDIVIAVWMKPDLSNASKGLDSAAKVGPDVVTAVVCRISVVKTALSLS